ncbi:hypothetical protein D3C80_2134690 [compost metagenome]
MDVGARQDIIATIRSHTERATLIATSDAEEAHEVADRVLVMDHHTLREETKHSAFTGYQEDTV